MNKKAVLGAILVTMASSQVYADVIDKALDKAVVKLKQDISDQQVDQNKKPKRKIVEINGHLLAGYNTGNSEVEVHKLDISFDIHVTDKIKVGIDLDGRAAAGRGQVEEKLTEKLKSSPEFRASVEYAIRQSVAASLGVPVSYVQIPAAVVNAVLPGAAEKFAKETVSDDAVLESTVRQLYLSVDVAQLDNGKVNVTAGKVDPIYYREEAYGHFATAAPAARATLEYKSWSIVASAYNNRYNETWNIDGTSAGQVMNLVERAGHGDVLEYDLNSYEAAFVTNADAIASRVGQLIVAAGSRENNGVSGDMSNYVLVQINPEIGKFKIVLTASAEKFDENSTEAPDGTRVRVTTLVSRTITEKLSAYLQAYYGKQSGTKETEQAALIVGLERKVLQIREVKGAVRGSLFATRDTKNGKKETNSGAFLGFVVKVK